MNFARKAAFEEVAHQDFADAALSFTGPDDGD
jgi:hypothetical protein